MATPHALPPQFLARVADTFRVLGDPSRLQILQTLLGGPRTVSQIVAQTGKGQANVSKHLAVLAAAGLVARTPRGTQALYEVADPLVFKLCDLVCGALRARLAAEVKAGQRVLRRA
jgi:DNA-binding transcriptional ArsR family regulator